MSFATKSRADDERLLSALAMRGCGHGTTVIAAHLGYRGGPAVRTATIRVMRADRDESGEDPRVVMQGYPWSRA